MTNTDELLKQRGSVYNINGTYGDHGDVTQKMKEAARSHRGWNSLAGGQKEAIDMIFHKIGRVLNGDPYYKDNWDDIQGYAKLAGDISKPAQGTGVDTFKYLYTPKETTAGIGY